VKYVLATTFHEYVYCTIRGDLTSKSAIIGGEEQKTVNARELWNALGSKQQFGNWIQDRLQGVICK